MPVEVPPIKPGQPSEPPQESPAGNPRPDVPVPAQNPAETPQPQELPGQTPQESPLPEPAGPRTYPATDQGISIFSEARRGTDHARGAGRGIRRLARARAPDRGERLREGAERSESARRGGRAIRSNVGVTMGCAVLGSPCRAGTAHVMLFRPIGIERRNLPKVPYIGPCRFRLQRVGNTVVCVGGHAGDNVTPMRLSLRQTM